MTYEEFAEIMDNSNFMIDSSNPYDMKILESLEKQIPKKLNKTKNRLYPLSCPNCDCGFMDDVDYDYCPSCGQAFLWRGV